MTQWAIPCLFIDFFINPFIQSKTSFMKLLKYITQASWEKKKKKSHGGKSSTGAQHCIKLLTTVFDLDLKSIPLFWTTGSQTHCYCRASTSSNSERPASKQTGEKDCLSWQQRPLLWRARAGAACNLSLSGTDWQCATKHIEQTHCIHYH